MVDREDDVLRALAEPRRRAILQLVAAEELAAGEIAAAFEVTRTAVSQHLSVLKKSGLISERKVATRRLYRARPEGLAGLRRLLDDMSAASAGTTRELAEGDREGVRDGRREAAPGA
jgi:DNA-binding transcriptional ArsR family regulator